MTIIPVGPYRPDQPETVPGVMRVMPQAQSLGSLAVIADAELGIAYAPGDTLTSLGASSIGHDPLSYLTATTQAGSYVVFVTTQGRIYQMGATGAFTQIGSGYNCPAGDRWSACQFGTKAIFTNKNDGMLQYDIEAGGAVTAISGAPKARIVRTIFDVLMALDCDGDNKLARNSDFDYTNWTTGVSGYQPMPDGLELMGVEEVSDGTAILFQRDRIRVLSRTADQSLYQMRLMATNTGAVTPWCIVNALGSAFYIDPSGVKSADAGGIHHIGDGKVDRTHVGNQTTAWLNGFTGAYDPIREAVVWGMGEPLGPYTQNILIYYTRLNEFLAISGSSGQYGFLMTSASPGYTMEDLDAFGTMDTITTSLDDRFWYGGELSLGSIQSTTGSFGIFAPGNGQDVIFRMGAITSLNRQLINRFTPITDGPLCLVYSISAYETLDASAMVTGTSSVASASGNVQTRAAGKRFVVTILAPSPTVAANVGALNTTLNWTYFRGIDGLQTVDQGAR